ncbi:hypothetical protein POSPLADRAFT_1048877 [Postia placenta MAD-698-R-SB12]|uniref:Uncharacterized protein n=1 Tax=Postia placenta MAD-698-R-SB12 TaxID=670580 RepID=A0A1X6MTC4_9APHY|nr:hypothetical protein POSPLADRAFT_1048877 [Postia placenta MAD-698-R-SB12]OSX59569.1 hypothetical protein POSPLADRAFT_1048877 [Postia placenta MAD-698-R-SB12]
MFDAWDVVLPLYRFLVLRLIPCGTAAYELSARPIGEKIDLDFPICCSPRNASSV